MEVKEQERDLKIHEIIAANQCLAESDKILKEQVALLQEAFLVGNTEWEVMKVPWKTMKEYSVGNNCYTGSSFHDTQTHMMHRLPKVDLNKFDGSNPTKWVG